MAVGDVVVFAAAKEKMGDGALALSTGPFHIGLITSAATPTETATDPRWGSGGTTNYSSNEVTPGGNYSAGGPQLDVTITDNWSLSGATATFDLDDVSISQHASNPTNARWGIIYQNDANDYAIAYVDLGSDRDLSGGNFTITWNASGLFTLA